MNKLHSTVIAGSLLVLASIPTSASERDLRCSLSFNSKAWSALYSSAVGEGTVTCEDGAPLQVSFAAKGVGITAGKWKITKGTGKFTRVARIEDVLGSYLALSGDLGVAKAGTAQVLTKGDVSLALAGKGDGFDVGIAISEFRISRRNEAEK
ncbi:hypothetical protein [Stenotrophomonas sp. DDT-1]|uniref:hypothetical protein n=1 Tax=Stenotrophomonas sp. DDT-1 TaxID=1609637 RepID=UPI000A58B42D|nr:hypothetical protein [Stenotrophomonas sp. DDT-1]